LERVGGEHLRGTAAVNAARSTEKGREIMEWF
jgi:hypothetical protein